jgi:multiple sugar transport system substrate-binding protein
MSADQISTFSDAKNIAMYTSCKNQATAWDVTKFATSKEQDGKLLEATGQMPMRTDLTTTYADYFAKNPAYKTFAAQAARTVEVPNIPASIEVWQAFRDQWTKSVIFAKTPVDSSLAAAAKQADDLAAQS